MKQPGKVQKDVRERLRFASNFVADEYVQDIMDALSEIDRLRAENGKLTMENDSLRAIKGRQEVDRLRAENAELRAALQEIEEVSLAGSLSLQVARAILAKTAKEGE